MKRTKIKGWAIINNSMFPEPYLAKMWIETPWGKTKSDTLVRIHVSRKAAEEDAKVNSGDIRDLLSVIPVLITILPQRYKTKTKR